MSELLELHAKQEQRWLLRATVNKLSDNPNGIYGVSNNYAVYRVQLKEDHQGFKKHSLALAIKRMSLREEHARWELSPGVSYGYGRKQKDKVLLTEEELDAHVTYAPFPKDLFKDLKDVIPPALGLKVKERATSHCIRTYNYQPEATLTLQAPHLEFKIHFEDVNQFFYTYKLFEQYESRRSLNGFQIVLDAKHILHNYAQVLAIPPQVVDYLDVQLPFSAAMLARLKTTSRYEFYLINREVDADWLYMVSKASPERLSKMFGEEYPYPILPIPTTPYHVMRYCPSWFEHSGFAFLRGCQLLQ